MSPGTATGAKRCAMQDLGVYSDEDKLFLGSEQSNARSNATMILYQSHDRRNHDLGETCKKAEDGAGSAKFCCKRLPTDLRTPSNG